MQQITLYTKEGCHLCEEVATALTTLASDFPHQLTKVDITTDADLHAKYFLTIPVVHIGAIVLEAPISVAQLRQALAAQGSMGQT